MLQKFVTPQFATGAPVTWRRGERRVPVRVMRVWRAVSFPCKTKTQVQKCKGCIKYSPYLLSVLAYQ